MMIKRRFNFRHSDESLSHMKAIVSSEDDIPQALHVKRALKSYYHKLLKGGKISKEMADLVSSAIRKGIQVTDNQNNNQ